MPDEPRSILIIRLSAIGDVVMASAILPPLRQRYPSTYIAWLVEPAAYDLLRHNPLLDEVIVWPRHRWRHHLRRGEWQTLLQEFRTLVALLRSRRFEWALDLQGLLKSGLWAWLSRADRRVGLGSKEGSQLLMHQVVSRPPSGGRIGAEYLRLANELGLSEDRFTMSLWAGSSDQAAARAKLRSKGITRRFAVICPFTTRAQKHWISERWVELGRRVHEALGLDVVMLGGPKDVTAASTIASANPCIHNLVGSTTLGETVAVIERASLLVGVDTGLTHLAIAFNVPTVALFGSTCPYLDAASQHGAILYHPLDCSPCQRRPTCAGRYTCMRLHQVDAVLRTAESIAEGLP